ncbi:MAG TPA: DMT family transporter [Burkholderiaceae bacterium]|nr:DMT family transporter [Burkholderiaceae bacterium]
MSRRDLLLLVALTLAWGVNWPVMKFGVLDLPPLYFRIVCISGGLVVLWLYARFIGIPLAVPRGRWREVWRLAFPNIIVWHVLVVVAIKLLPAGRAAILGYTMPVWAVLAGLAFFDERPSRRHWWGVAAALAGALLLLSSELSALSGNPLGTGLILFAAACWGYGTHLMRRHLRDIPALAVTFWMLVLVMPFMIVGSLLFERASWRQPTPPEWASIAYNIFLAIAFCHVVWSHLARTLPPVASGLSVMMIPVVGVFSSVWMLGEEPLWQDYVALALILFALSTVLLGPKTVQRDPAAAEP